MGRILFFLLLAIAVWVGWRLWKEKLRLQAKRDADDARRAVEGEVLVPCRLCGVRLPRSAAVSVRVSGDSSDDLSNDARDGRAEPDRLFCSAQHRDEYERTR